MANILDPLKAEARSTVLQEVLYERFVWRLIADTKFEWLFSSGNDVVHFPRLTPIISQPLATSYTPVTVQDLVTTDETMVLDTRVHRAFEISNEDLIEMAISPETQAIRDGAEAFARDYDTAIMEEYVNAWYIVDDGNMEVATNGWAWNDIVLSQVNIYDLVTAIEETMDSNNMPTAWRFLVISPREKRFFNKAPELLRSTVMGDQTVAEWFMGTINNVAIIVSNNISTTTVGPDTTRHCLAWAGKPVCFAANVRPNVEITPSVYRNSFASLVKAQTKFGVKTFFEWANKLVHVPVVA